MAFIGSFPANDVRLKDKYKYINSKFKRFKGRGYHMGHQRQKQRKRNNYNYNFSGNRNLNYNTKFISFIITINNTRYSTTNAFINDFYVKYRLLHPNQLKKISIFPCQNEIELEFLHELYAIICYCKIKTCKDINVTIATKCKNDEWMAKNIGIFDACVIKRPKGININNGCINVLSRLNVFARINYRSKYDNAVTIYIVDEPYSYTKYKKPQPLLHELDQPKIYEISLHRNNIASWFVSENNESVTIEFELETFPSIKQFSYINKDIKSDLPNINREYMDNIKSNDDFKDSNENIPNYASDDESSFNSDYQVFKPTSGDEIDALYITNDTVPVCDALKILGKCYKINCKYRHICLERNVEYGNNKRKWDNPHQKFIIWQNAAKKIPKNIGTRIIWNGSRYVSAIESIMDMAVYIIKNA